MTDDSTDADANDITIAYRLHAEFAEKVKDHEVVTDYVWGTAIDGEFEDGWLQSETCTIRVTTSIAMDEPAWKIINFEAAVTDQATITERRVKGSFAAPIRYTDTGIPVPGNVDPPAEEDRTHTGYYTVEWDVTDQLTGPRR